VYNHLPRIDPTRSLDGGARHASESEQAVLRRLHREHAAAERARTREQHPDASFGAHTIGRPIAAIWGLVGMRR
jgi:hypothetical protein